VPVSFAGARQFEKSEMRPVAIFAQVLCDSEKRSYGKPGPVVISRQSSPHLPTTHVTPRRSAHPRFTSTSPILTSLLVRTLPPHLCSPVLPRMCSSPVARLSRASTPGEKDSRELEQTPGGP